MRRFAHVALYVPAIAVAAVAATRPELSAFVLFNVVVQVGLFAGVAAVPAYRTRTMSYVDIAWPWGLTAIGVQAALIAPESGARATLIGAIYVAMGLRMGLPGVVYLARHGRLTAEFPRYRYQRLRWTQAGFTGERLPMQLEIFVQCAANASVLATPAVLLACDRSSGVSLLSVVAGVGWLACWSLEWLADRQKRRFMVAARATGERGRTCRTGLWRYSRHPNYFFQWLGWVALAVAAVPSLLRLSQTMPTAVSTVMAVALIAAPGFMYWTLVHFTGIQPSEYYSVRKRSDYAEYQRTTNRFVPGFR